MAADSTESFEVWDAWVRGEGPSSIRHYLILTQSSTFKYLEEVPALSPAVGQSTHLPDIYGRRLAFDRVPCGDWTTGHLARQSEDSRNSNSSSGKLVLQATKKIALADVCQPWSSTKIDFLDLPPRLPLAAGSGSRNDPESDPQCAGRLAARISVAPPHPPPPTSHSPDHSITPEADCSSREKKQKNREAITFWAWDPEFGRSLARESQVYGWVEGHDVAAQLLAHVTANGCRTIGFMVERVVGARMPDRNSAADREACAAVLGRLHALGIVHGRLGRGAFVVVGSNTGNSNSGRGGGRDGRKAYLQGFGCAYRAEDPGDLEREMASLPSALLSASRGTPWVGPRRQKL